MITFLLITYQLDIECIWLPNLSGSLCSISYQITQHSCVWYRSYQLVKQANKWSGDVTAAPWTIWNAHKDCVTTRPTPGAIQQGTTLRWVYFKKDTAQLVIICACLLFVYSGNKHSSWVQFSRKQDRYSTLYWTSPGKYQARETVRVR